jgi:hypothetical protein
VITTLSSCNPICSNIAKIAKNKILVLGNKYYMSLNLYVSNIMLE